MSVTYYKNKNLFDYEAHCRIVTVNCVGVMGKGIALDFKNSKKYGGCYYDYKNLCDSGYLYPGMFDIRYPYCYEPIDGKYEHVYFMATKDHWRDPSKLEWVESALYLMKYWSLTGCGPTNSGDKWNITLPAPGCGNGGLSFDKQVKPLIDKLFYNTKHNLMVFHG